MRSCCSLCLVYINKGGHSFGVECGKHLTLTIARLDEENASLPEMEALQGERSIFSAHLCRGEKWPDQLQPKATSSHVTLANCLNPPTFPLSHPFCW